MAAITLPHNWEARDYQAPLVSYMLKGGLDKKRAVAVWHRRAGKDSVSLQIQAIASQNRVGTYWHMLPSLQQGRRVIWDGIDKQGRRMIYQAFPKELIANVNNSEMKIDFKNGSVWQVVGSDNFDSLVGSNPVGIIMSEYSIANPLAWEYFRPILLENDGFATFIYTPRGKTHGYNLYEMALKNPNWFCEKLTIDDTGILTREQYEEEILSGMSREKAMQEFLCSFDIGIEGSYYTEELAYAEAKGHIGEYPWDPQKPVSTFWDIGFRDNTSIIFTQPGDDGNPIIIDHATGRNKGLPTWIKYIKDEPYDYDTHFGPHDLEQTEWGSEATKTELAHKLAFDFEVIDKISIADGIDMARIMLRKAKMDRVATEGLRNSLGWYHREYDEKRQIFKDKPNHDWSSHDADAFRYLSTAWNTRPKAGRILVPGADGRYTANVRVKRARGGSSRSMVHKHNASPEARSARTQSRNKHGR
jgi:phage terminase large subunit